MGKREVSEDGRERRVELHGGRWGERGRRNV